ncbi:MAG TPA: STAS domain-containing protein [Acidimicrobiia bacterium]|nr:STAS domain-containing protein [Acidimicrobiia bacterium]
MPQARVAMTVRDAGEGTKVIDIDGEISAFCESVMMDAYSEAAQPGVRSIVLDFEGLEYMNSGGIGLLVTMLIRAQRNGQTLSAFGLSDHYRQIFSLTRLDEAIELFDDERAAVTGR